MGKAEVFMKAGKADHAKPEAKKGEAHAESSAKPEAKKAEVFMKAEKATHAKPEAKKAAAHAKLHAVKPEAKKAAVEKPELAEAKKATVETPSRAKPAETKPEAKKSAGEIEAHVKSKGKTHNQVIADALKAARKIDQRDKARKQAVFDHIVNPKIPK